MNSYKFITEILQRKLYLKLKFIEIEEFLLFILSSIQKCLCLARMIHHYVCVSGVNNLFTVTKSDKLKNLLPGFYFFPLWNLSCTNAISFIL